MPGKGGLMASAPCTQGSLRLKRATRDLVRALGGIEVAADDLGKGKSTVHRWTDRNEADHFINIEDLAHLEAAAHRPLVTEQLARMAGCVLVTLPDDDLREPGAMADHMMDIMAQVGRLTLAVQAALHDGQVCAREVRELRALLADLITSGAGFDRMLAGAGEM